MHLPLHALYRPIQANGRVSSYRYGEIPPSSWLAPFVSCYWWSEPVAEQAEPHASQSLPEAVDRVLPDGCSDIVFVQDLKRNEYRMMFSGFLEEPFKIGYDKEVPERKFGVRFFPGGSHALFGVPLQELVNVHVDAESIWPVMAREIGSRLFEAPSFSRKVQIMERFLQSEIQARHTKNEDLLHNALNHIFSCEGRIRVQELAAREAVSSRQLNRVFERWIGTSPKRFCEIARFQALLNDMKRKQKVEGANLALRHGYFDQAHMIRDFKRFYGESPLVARQEFSNLSDLYNPSPSSLDRI